MSFPLDAYDRVAASPEDFRLAARVPFAAYTDHTEFPVALASPIGDEKPVVFLGMSTTGRFPQGDMVELALVRCLYSPSAAVVTAITDIYAGLERGRVSLSAERLAAMGYTEAEAENARLDEIRIATILEGKPLILCASARDRRPFFDRRFKGHFDDLPWGEAIADLDWEELTSNRVSVSGHLSLPTLINDMYSFYNPYSSREEALTVLWLMDSFNAVFDAVINRLELRVYIVEARMLPFELKDQVKARRYRWNAQKRLWFKECASDKAMDAEVKFLSELYDADQSKLVVQYITVTPFEAFKLIEAK